jgi:hypothetical protein
MTSEAREPVRDDEVEALLAALVERRALVTALRTFTAAAGEPELHDLWAMGWTH